MTDNHPLQGEPVLGALPELPGADAQERSLELRRLLERVEAATGADRELDALIDIACGPRPLGDIDHWVNSWEHGWRLGEIPGQIYMREHPGADDYANYAAPEVTASLDAALALVERVLPGSCVLLQITPRKTLVNLHERPIGEVGRWHPLTEAATPSLAICASLLKALIETNGDRS